MPVAGCTGTSASGERPPGGVENVASPKLRCPVEDNDGSGGLQATIQVGQEDTSVSGVSVDAGR